MFVAPALYLPSKLSSGKYYGYGLSDRRSKPIIIVVLSGNLPGLGCRPSCIFWQDPQHNSDSGLSRLKVLTFAVQTLSTGSSLLCVCIVCLNIAS